ncbi:MAG: HDIG domain-containing protein, partial [Planctomycetes bacterium]|nr:HDIG domain-containing protein [Planctomycetota bacterium]
MTRDMALAVFRKYNASPALFKHALMVEAAMRHFAAKNGEDSEYWGLVGLLHDVDYEKYPAEHCQKAPELLRAEGFDES